MAEYSKDLLKAVTNHDYTKIESLLGRTGIDVNLQDSMGRTPLTVAIFPSSPKGQYPNTKVLETPLKIFNRLLQMPGIDVNLQDVNGETALHHAVYKEKPDFIRALLQLENTDSSLRNNFGATSLIRLLQQRKVNINTLDYFLENPKLDVNQTDSKGMTPLMYAVIYFSTEVHKLHHYPCIQVNKQDQNVYTVMMHQLEKLNKTLTLQSAVNRILQMSTIQVNLQDKLGESALHHAVKKNSRIPLKALLEHEGTDSSLRDNAGETPLTIFLSKLTDRQNLEELDWFLKHPKIDVNHTDRQGRTPLMLAVIRYNIEVVKKLLKQPGIQLNVQDKDGYTAIMYLVKCPFEEIGTTVYILTIMLEQEHMDLNIKTPQGISLLSECKDPACLQKLMEHPTLEVNLMYGNNLTKFREFFLNQTNQTIVDAISRHPRFQVNGLRSDGQTDLTWAIGQKKVKMVRYLLQHREISVSQSDDNQHSPLMYLADWCNLDLMKELIDHPTFEQQDFCRKDKEGLTFLHHLFMESSNRCQPGSVEFLVPLIKQNEVDMSCGDSQGYTSLMHAVELAKRNSVKGLADLMQIMLEKCTNQEIAIKNKYNLTVLDLVQEYSNELEAPIKGIFKIHLSDQSTQGSQSDLSVAELFRILRHRLPTLKLPQDFTDHLVQQVDQLESDIEVFTGGHYGRELGMLKIHRDKLQGLHTFLLQNLEVREMLPHLYSAAIITENQKEELEAQELRYRIATKLLSILPTRGPQAYNAFIDALKNSGQEFIAKQLEEYDPGKKKTLGVSSGTTVSRYQGAGSVSMATGSTEEVVALNVAPDWRNVKWNDFSIANNSMGKPGRGTKRNKSGSTSKGQSPKLSPLEKKSKGSIGDYLEPCAEYNMATDNPSEAISEMQDMLKTILTKLEPVERMDNKIDLLTKSISEIKAAVEVNSLGIEAVNKDLINTDNKIREVSASLEFSQKEIDSLKEKLQIVESKQLVTCSTGSEQALKNKILKLENKIFDQEMYSRRDNLIFYGIEEKPGTREDVLGLIFQVLEQKLDLADARSRIKIVIAHRIGRNRKQGEDKPRQIIVRFHYYPDAEEIYKKRKILWENPASSRITRSSSGTPHCSGIGLDYPERIKTKRHYLGQVLKLVKRKDPKAYLKRDKIVYRGKAYTVQDCYHLPDVNVHELGQVVKADYVMFFGRFSPYSNFYPCKLVIDGQQFHSVEQFYQYRKAVFLGKEQTAIEILNADDPLDAKNLGDTLNSALWDKDISVAAMFQGVLSKFEENEPLKKLLQETINKTVVECNVHDSLWGSGTSLRDPNALKFKGKNMLGITLMKVRDQL